MASTRLTLGVATALALTAGLLAAPAGATTTPASGTATVGSRAAGQVPTARVTALGLAKTTQVFRYGTTPPITVYVTTNYTHRRAGGAVLGLEVFAACYTPAAGAVPVSTYAPRATGARGERTVLLPTLTEPCYVVRATATYGTGAARVSRTDDIPVGVGPRISREVSDARVKAGTVVTITGRIVPAKPAGTTVLLQRRLRQGTSLWSGVVRGTVGADGRYSVSYRVPRGQRYHGGTYDDVYRIKTGRYAAPGGRYWDTGYSKLFRIVGV